MDVKTQKFTNAEQAWLWAAKNPSHRSSHKADAVRPCTPMNILIVVDRLHRAGAISIDHLRVLRFYGHRQRAPDEYCSHEQRAATIWQEAMIKLEEALVREGFVKRDGLYGI